MERSTNSSTQGRRAPTVIRSINPQCKMSSGWIVERVRPDLGDGLDLLSMKHIVLLGARGLRRRLSSFHSEMETLLWEMPIILDSKIYCQVFQMDCSEVINITQSPQECPTFSIFTDKFCEFCAKFPSFFLFLTLRSLNLKADCLVCSARISYFLIFVCKQFS